jgi:hypothetical protein
MKFRPIYVKKLPISINRYAIISIVRKIEKHLQCSSEPDKESGSKPEQPPLL